jgi:Ni/Co efflux regulator RcnB
MYKKALLAAIAASMLISQTAALAAGPGYNPHQPPTPPPPGINRPAPPPAYGPPQGYNRYKSSNSWRGRHGAFRPGQAIPPYYFRDYNRYAINDWRRYNLYPPPPGHRWMMVDGNFVLAAISTGIITTILLGR